MSDKKTEYWFNTKTGEVEVDAPRSSWNHLLGPYPSREAAQNALDYAKQRNDSWDDDDADWRGGGA